MMWISMSILLLQGLMFHLLSMKRDQFFGVPVTAAFRHSAEGMRLVERYLMAIWALTVIALGLVLWQETWLPWAIIGQIGIATGLFCAINRKVRRSGMAGSEAGVRTTSLGAVAPRIPFAWLATLIPVLLLVSAGLYISQHWDQFPPRFPVHYGVQGPNRWVAKSFKSVYGLLIIGALLEATLGFLAYGLTSGTRRALPGSARMKMLTSNVLLLLILQLHLGFMFAYLALQPVLGGRPSNVLMLGFVGSLVVLVFGFVFYMVKLQREPGNESDNTPESAWKLGGMIYFNREDPALMVERRFGFGFTPNFGNALSWPFAGLVALVTILPYFLFQ